ncbi:MAG: recombinase family protein [Eubacterium sp.]|nr:recombinase family protein [Eubacterium sp.]
MPRYYDENDARRRIKKNNIDRNKPRKTALYTRVSTEHEKQIYALEKQIQWGKNLIENLGNKCIFDENEDIYVDEGISATSLKHRDQLNKLLNDARQGKYQLIIVRDMSRFMRNLREALNTVDELIDLGVEVYFADDNIWTFDADSHDILIQLANVSQKESERISNKVFAGQSITRENGVLFGNGNILGYDVVKYRDENNRERSKYVINEEQANTVKLIYDLAFQGLGVKKIKARLEAEGRKTSCGKTRWFDATIERILRNKTYTGYYNAFQSVTDDCLTHKRVKNSKSDYKEFKCPCDPIIPRDYWEEVQKRIDSRIVWTSPRKHGVNVSSDKFLPKLRCGCGRKFKKDLCRMDGTATYRCYQVVDDGSQQQRRINSQRLGDDCCIDGIIDWKLELYTYKVFEYLKLDIDEIRKAIISLAEESFVIKSSEKLLMQYEQKLEKINEGKKRAFDAYCDGAVSLELYKATCEKYDLQADELRVAIDELNQSEPVDFEKELKKERTKIIEYVDKNVFIDGRGIKNGTVSKTMIDCYVQSIKARSGGIFEYTINFGNDAIEDKNMNLPNYIIDNTSKQLLTEIQVTYEDAKAYANKMGRRVLRTHFEKPIIIRIFVGQ